MGIYGHRFDNLLENKQFENENQEYMQEGFLLGIALGALKAIGIFIAANALLVGAIFLAEKANTAEKKRSEKDVLDNPKSKDLIIKSLEKLQDFIIQNLPNEAKKYATKSEINFNSAADKRLRQPLVFLDLEKMIIDLANPKCKSLDDVYLKEWPYNPDEEDCTEKEHLEKIYENPDTYISMDGKNNNIDYSKIISLIDKCEDSIVRINKQINKNNKSNFTLSFDNMNYCLQYNGEEMVGYGDPYTQVTLKFSTSSISSYSDKDIEFIAKTCGVSVDDIKGI